MNPIRVLDVCSGYSASTLAWDGLGFEHVGYAEIDAFPCAVLGARYGATRPRYMPDPEVDGISAKERKTRIALRKSIAALSDSHFGNRVVNYGDFTQIREDDVGPLDALTGGTPCQSFSVAGKRLGLDDPRGNLTLEFLALAKRLRVEWLAWENVPGFLSHDGGRTMGTFLGLLGELGYGWAYRVLDAQYIRVDGHERAVPQRRKRLVLVGHLGDSAGPAAVLFERESLRGDSAPSRRSLQDVARPLASGSQRGSGYRNDADTAENLIAGIGYGGGNCSGSIDAAACLTAKGQRIDFEVETFIAHTLRAQPNLAHQDDRDTLVVGVPEIAASLTRDAESAGKGGYAGRRQEDDTNLVAHSLRAEGFDASEDGTGRGTPLTVEYGDYRDRLPGEGANDYWGRMNEVERLVPFDTTQITSPANRSPAIDGAPWAVRRLTPTECARLMAIPDDFLRITFRGKPAADGPIYKAAGNSQAGNMMRWLGRGLADVIRAQRSAAESERTAA